MYHNASAILAVSSLDRYTTGIAGSPARKDTGLLNLYEGIGQPGNEFQLSSSGAFIYGYIKRIAISQVQLEYRIPTVVPSNRIQFGNVGANDPTKAKRLGNDIFAIAWGTAGPQDPDIAYINIPYGFYSPDELAAMMQVQIRSLIPDLSGMTVTYSNAGTGDNPLDPNQPTQPGNIGYGNAFTFQVDPNSNYRFFFPSYNYLKAPMGAGGGGLNDDQLIIILKTYRLFGITIEVSRDDRAFIIPIIQTASPNFLFTPYIDIVSNNLTKFQKVKDSDTTTTGRVALISRTYLSGATYPQPTSGAYTIGSEPFTLTADLNTPKIIRWNKDETVYNLDFSLYDQYGDLIYWTNDNPTEFQMTLLCQEEDND